MSQTSVLVVEDEPIIADDIAMNLEDFGYSVSGIAASVDEALEAISKSAPQMALVDINLEGEKDGIELGELLNKKYKIPFMYITSYFDAATIQKVKKTNPVAYLIKPFDERDLKINLELAFAKQKPLSYRSKKLFVKKNQELIALEPQFITHVEAIDNYAYVYTANEKFMISHTLKSIEEKLIDKGFLRVHKSYLINFEHISSIAEGFIYLGSTQIPIGKSYKQDFFDFIITL